MIGRSESSSDWPFAGDTQTAAGEIRESSHWIQSEKNGSSFSPTRLCDFDECTHKCIVVVFVCSTRTVD